MLIESSKTRDDWSVALLLIEGGENVNARAAHDQRRTALQLAVGKENLDIVHFLLSRGADVNGPAGKIRGKTALQFAVEIADITRNLVMVEFLLQRGGAEENDLLGYEYGRSAFQLATSAEEVFPELIDRLLEAGADINLPTSTVAGFNALQGAAIWGHAKLVLKLFKSGAHVNAPGVMCERRTAIERAAKHGRLDTVQIILNADADSHLVTKRRYAIRFAEKNHHFTVAKLLKERRERDLQNE